MAIERLKKRADFLEVAKNGKKSAAKALALQFLEKNDSDKIQVGFTVTKKIGKAVVRNRVRRRLKAAVDSVFNEMNIKSGEYVLIGRFYATERPFKDLQKDLKYTLYNIGAIISQK